jgi:hypothetical protein
MTAVFFKHGKQVGRFELHTASQRVWLTRPRKKGWAELYRFTHVLPAGEWAFSFTPQEGE